MTRSRKITLALAIAAVVAMGLLLSWRKPAEALAGHSPPPPATPQAPAAPPPAPERNAAPGAAGAKGVAAAREPGWPIDAAFRARIDRAVATGDKLEWMPAMTDLLNPLYDRAQATGILVDLLRHDSWEVRVYAADLLLQMGARDGVAVLQSALRSAAEGREISELAVATAATRLHLYREPIDAQALVQAYARFKTPELLNVLIMQQVPELAGMVRSRWAENIEGFQSTRLAAFAGLKDDGALAYLRRALEGEPRTQVVAQWALYQATGDERHLDQLVAWARETSGLAPKTEAANRLMAGEVLDLLGITLTPRATEALRGISDAAATQSGNQATFGRTFTALFYLHQDYDFVDRRLLAFFEGQFQGAGIDRRLMMRIAAARGTPELAAAAHRFNASAYEREFVLERNRPVEQWVNLINVPVSVAPSLKSTVRP